MCEGGFLFLNMFSLLMWSLFLLFFCFSLLMQAANEDEMVEWIEAIQTNLECVPPEDGGQEGGGGDSD